MESTIRISVTGERRPTGGLVGALTGGTEPGSEAVIEVDLREATGGDISSAIPIVAEAYRLAHFGERSSEAIIEVPFPEAGDDHPFPDGLPHIEPGTGRVTYPDPDGESQPGTPKKGHKKRVDRAYELVQSVLNSSSPDDASPVVTIRIIQALTGEGLIR